MPLYFQSPSAFDKNRGAAHFPSTLACRPITGIKTSIDGFDSHRAITRRPDCLNSAVNSPTRGESANQCARGPASASSARTTDSEFGEFFVRMRIPRGFSNPIYSTIFPPSPARTRLLRLLRLHRRIICRNSRLLQLWAARSPRDTREQRNLVSLSTTIFNLWPGRSSPPRPQKDYGRGGVKSWSKNEATGLSPVTVPSPSPSHHRHSHHLITIAISIPASSGTQADTCCEAKRPAAACLSCAALSRRRRALCDSYCWPWTLPASSKSSRALPCHSNSKACQGYRSYTGSRSVMLVSAPPHTHKHRSTTPGWPRRRAGTDAPDHDRTNNDIWQLVRPQGPQF